MSGDRFIVLEPQNKVSASAKYGKIRFEIFFLQTGIVQITAWVKNNWNRMWCSCTATLWIPVEPCDAAVNQLLRVQLVIMGVTAEDIMFLSPIYVSRRHSCFHPMDQNLCFWLPTKFWLGLDTNDIFNSLEPLFWTILFLTIYCISGLFSQGQYTSLPGTK